MSAAMKARQSQVGCRPLLEAWELGGMGHLSMDGIDRAESASTTKLRALGLGVSQEEGQEE